MMKMNDKSLIELAPAKVNLSLGIVGKQADNYHLLEMINHNVTLADRLILTPADKFSFDSNNKFLANTNNTVIKAIRILSQLTGQRPNFNLYLEKNIPEQAGLAGGSADAAAAIRLVSKYWGLDMDPNALIPIALKIGADVPYCLFNKTAYVTGIGEKILPIRDFEPGAILILQPSFQVETPKAYSVIDQIDDLYIPDALQVIKDIEDKNYDHLKESAGNSFLEPINQRYPLVEEMINRLYNNGAFFATMSGSGSSIIGYFNSVEERDKAAENFPDIKYYKTEVFNNK